MKRIGKIAFVFLFAGCFCFMNSCESKKESESQKAEQKEEPLQESDTEESSEVYPEGVIALMESYPDNVKGYEDGYVIMADNTRILYDDGKEKSFPDMLDNSSLKDMFYVAYKVPESSPEYLADAGRSRNEQLFKNMYGASPEAVTKNLVTVNWFGQNLPFTSVNGASEQLKKVASELAQHPELSKYMKSAGTYYWRKVRGAERQSAHSYGIAIDIGVDYSDYWLWKNPGAREEAKIQYVNRFPKEVVEIFQKYGFIWGGSWYHFDTMHFEYRPEILNYAEITESTSSQN